MSTQKINFLHEISISALTKVLLYKSLAIYDNKQSITGNDLLKRINELSSGYWQPSHDTIYKLLNKMEKEELLTSRWDDNDLDKNKRYKRLYVMTDKGVINYGPLQYEYVSLLKSMLNKLDICIKFLFKNEPEFSAEVIKLDELSSDLFHEINLLQLLSRQNDYIHGTLMIEKLRNTYQGSWEPSFGTMYPKLSKLLISGYVHDRWSVDENSPKKKGLREYVITSKGRNLLASYKTQTDLYYKLKAIQKMYMNFYNFLAT